MAKGFWGTAKGLARPVATLARTATKLLACVAKAIVWLALEGAPSLARKARLLAHRANLWLHRRNVALPLRDPSEQAAERLMAHAIRPQMPPDDTDLEQIYPAAGASAETRLVRMGGRVGKEALTPAAEERLLTEFRALSSLEGSKFYPQVFGLSRIQDEKAPSGEALCLAEEFIEGEDLAHYLARIEGSGRRVDPTDAVGLLAQLLYALSVAHSAGWVHRDVHPKNVVVMADGRVKIVDLGCAVLAQECANGLHREKILSLGYEPPESAQYGPWSFASDVYSACAICARLLYGQATPPASDTSPVGRFLMRGMAALPQERYRNAQEAYRALSQAAAEMNLMV